MRTELHLEKLLRNIDPKLQDEVYVFCPVPESRLHQILGDCLCIFRERESLSAILPRFVAEREGLEASGGFRQITLQVYSSLETLGLTAAVAGELAGGGISANIVSGLNHDHLLVPEEQAEKALQLLRGISNRAQYS